MSMKDGLSGALPRIESKAIPIKIAFFRNLVGNGKEFGKSCWCKRGKIGCIFVMPLRNDKT